MKILIILLISAVSVAFASSATAAINITHTNRVLDSVTIDRGANQYTYQAADLVGIDLVGFSGDSNANIIVPSGDALPAAGSRAALLDGDFSLSTGLINPSTTAGTGIIVNFSSLLINSEGADLLFFETDNATPEGVVVTNGANVFTASTYTALNLGLVDLTVHRVVGATNDPVVNLTELENGTSPGMVDVSDFDVFVSEIDLSDLGVPLGGSVASLQFNSTGGGGDAVDPVAIFGLLPVPEPSVSLLCLGGFALAAARRRRC